MLVNPELYENLQTRLKFSTAAPVSQLIRTDQSIDKLLNDPRIPVREKQRALAQSLQELETYKDMIEDYQTTPNRLQRHHDAMLPNIDLLRGTLAATPTAAAATGPYRRQSLQQPQKQRSMLSLSRMTSPQLASTPKDGHDDDDDGTTASSFQSLPSENRTIMDDDVKRDLLLQKQQQQQDPSSMMVHSIGHDSSQCNQADQILSMIPEDQRETATATLSAVYNMPQDLLHIDSDTLEFMVKGQRVGHATDILNVIGNPSLVKKSSRSPVPGIQQVLQTLATESDLPATVIKSPQAKTYFEKARDLAAKTKLAAAAVATVTPVSKRIRQQRNTFGNPANFKDWTDVSQLPTRETRTGKKF